MSSKSVKFLPASNKTINPIQKYPHITCFILEIFTTSIDLLINLLTSFGICSTPKLSRKESLLFNACKTIQWVSTPECSSRFTTYGPSFI